MILEKEANSIFQEIMEEKLTNFNFELVLNKDGKYGMPYLRRYVNENTERIGSIHLNLFNNEIHGILSFSKRFERLEEIWSNYYCQINPVGKSFDPQSLVTLATNVKALKEYKFDPKNKGSWYRLKQRFKEEASETGIIKMADLFVTNIRESIIPFFSKYNSYKTLDSLINSTPETYWECIHIFQAKGLYFKKMIIARLSGNPQYDNICEFCFSRLNELEESNRQKYIDVFFKLKSDLDCLS